MANNGLQSTNPNFCIIWDRNRDCCCFCLLLHDDVATSLPHLNKSILGQDLTHFLSRENPKLTQPQSPIE